MSATLAAGARFVHVDTALARLDLASDQLGLALNWRHGPARRDIGHASFGAARHAFLGLGRRPYAPVHVRASRSGGDLALTWIRRARRDGDSWDVAEVPLVEDDERYEVDIVAGSTVRRTIATTMPSALYSAADQTADFGAPQPSVSVRVHQLSASYGRGPGADATL